MQATLRPCLARSRRLGTRPNFRGEALIDRSAQFPAFGMNRPLQEEFRGRRLNPMPPQIVHREPIDDDDHRNVEHAITEETVARPSAPPWPGAPELLRFAARYTDAPEDAEDHTSGPWRSPRRGPGARPCPAPALSSSRWSSTRPVRSPESVGGRRRPSPRSRAARARARTRRVRRVARTPPPAARRPRLPHRDRARRHRLTARA